MYKNFLFFYNFRSQIRALYIFAIDEEVLNRPYQNYIENF